MNQTHVIWGQVYLYEAKTLGLAGRCLQMSLGYFLKFFKEFLRCSFKVQL